MSPAPAKSISEHLYRTLYLNKELKDQNRKGLQRSLFRASMVALSDPYRSLASQGGEDQGEDAGPFETKVVVLLR